MQLQRKTKIALGGLAFASIICLGGWLRGSEESESAIDDNDYSLEEAHESAIKAPEKTAEQQSAEEAKKALMREMGRKGGKKSAETRRKKKQLKEEDGRQP